MSYLAKEFKARLIGELLSYSRNSLKYGNVKARNLMTKGYGVLGTARKTYHEDFPKLLKKAENYIINKYRTNVTFDLNSNQIIWQTGEKFTCEDLNVDMRDDIPSLTKKGYIVEIDRSKPRIIIKKKVGNKTFGLFETRATDGYRTFVDSDGSSGRVTFDLECTVLPEITAALDKICENLHKQQPPSDLEEINRIYKRMSKNSKRNEAALRESLRMLRTGCRIAKKT